MTGAARGRAGRGVLAAAVLLLGAGVARAQGAGHEASSLVVTHAEARQRLANTVADASVTVEVHGRDLRATAAALARSLETLLAFLRAQAPERLRTETESFTPELQALRGAPDRIKGFTGTQTLSLRTTPERLPALLAGSLDNGATSVAQSGAAPREEEVEAARAELVARAARSAMERARAAAAAVGQRVVGVERLEVDPQGGGAAEPAMMEKMAPPPPPPAAALRPVASEAGETEVTASVLLAARLAAAE